MVKQRLTSGDIAAEVACLRDRIVGLRISNVYDINPKVWAGLGAHLILHACPDPPPLQEPAH